MKERGREENGTKGRKGHPSKTRRSFRTNSTTTDESLLACLLAQFPGMETGTIMIYIYIISVVYVYVYTYSETLIRPRFRCPSLSLASLSLEYDTKTYTGKEMNDV